MQKHVPIVSQNIINTKEDLQVLVAEALKIGVLDISGYTFDVSFNLCELLEGCGQQLSGEPEEWTHWVECPFELKTDNNTVFNNMVKFTGVIFNSKISFFGAKFKEHTIFSNT